MREQGTLCQNLSEVGGGGNQNQSENQSENVLHDCKCSSQITDFDRYNRPEKVQLSLAIFRRVRCVEILLSTPEDDARKKKHGTPSL